VANAPKPCSLHIQSVVYRNGRSQVERLIRSLGAAVAVARVEGLVGGVEMRLGDSSEPGTSRITADDVVAWSGDAGIEAEYDAFEENLGSAGGNNRLARRATADFLLLVNPDTYAAPAMIAELVAAHRPGVAAVEARQIPAEHPKWYDPGDWTTPWVTSAALLLDRAAFDAVGGLDPEHFFLHGDDVDLSWRLRLAGYDLLLAPAAVVFHDKRFDEEGRVLAPEAERYHHIHGRLMLAERYGLGPLAERVQRFVEGSGDEAQREALADFLDRKERGLVPDPIEGAARVAEIHGPHLAGSRF
jgi:GT2 family glycosyltransferase